MPSEALGRNNIRESIREPLVSVACVAFASLFFAGDVKASALFSWMPIDLTVGIAILAALLSVMSFLARNGKIDAQLMWMLVLFFLLSVPILWTEWGDYSVSKVSRLLTFGLLSALIPYIVLTRINTVRFFVNAMILSGVLIAFAGLMQVLHGVSSYDKVSGISADTIGLGRNAGIALVGLYTASLSGNRLRMWMAMLCPPLFLVLVSSGSRGPVLFAVVTLLFVTLRWSLGKLNRISTVVLVLAALVFSLFHLAQNVPDRAIKRIEGFLEQRYDASSAERYFAGRVALQQIAEKPLGLGLGGFGRVYNFGSITDRVYPHNMVLEIAVECGWITGLFFLFLLALCVKRAYQAACEEPRMRPFFAIFIFALCNAMVSGDMNDNRAIYALMSIALMAPGITIADRRKSFTLPAATGVR